jgi:excisionase family DNA binding protein
MWLMDVGSLIGMAVVTDDRYVTPEEIAVQLRCSVRMINRAIEEGRLAAVRPGVRTYRVREDDYLVFVGKSASPGGAGDPVPAASVPAS